MFFCLPCLTLIIYFTIVGIFIPSKRAFIKEAIKCFWKKLTLQHCTDSFDDLVHKRFVMWLLDRKPRLAKFFGKKIRFDLFLSFTAVIFTIVNVLLLVLLYKWLFIKSPCEAGGGVCPP